MTFMLTNTGREHHLSGIAQQFNAPTIEEIAHALAQINRFTGHALRPYSVAEHSLLVAAIADSEGATPVQKLAALLHDAHEAYVGDLASPSKWAIGEPWQAFEHGQEVAVHQALGIRSAMVSNAARIKRWDLIALATERRDLFTWDPATNTPWPILDTPGQQVHPIELRLNCELRADTAWFGWAILFLEKFDQLIRLIKQQQGAEAVHA